MSMFGNIVSALFHHASAATPTQTASADTPASSGAPTAATPAASSAPNAAAPAASGSAPQTVDAKAVLEGLAAKNPQKLDWQHSIVDMMKLLDLDSSLTSRKQLAQELHYTGDTEDSGAMNVWLHGQVMQKLSANGGKVPADLKV